MPGHHADRMLGEARACAGGCMGQSASFGGGVSTIRCWPCSQKRHTEALGVCCDVALWSDRLTELGVLPFLPR